MSEARYVATRRLRGTILAVTPEDLIIMRGGTIERCDFNFQQFEPIGTWDKSWRSQARLWSLSARFLRLNVGPSAWLADTLVVVTRQGILRIRPHTSGIEMVPLPEGVKAPLTLTLDRGQNGAEDALLFGDYRANRNMEPIALFKLRRTGPPELITRTENGQINHIHSVIPSKDGSSYFVLSGDYNGAARIWRLPRSGTVLVPVSPIGQKFRSCWLVENDQGFIYATDRQDKVNELSLFNFKNSAVELISEIGGSSIDHLPCPDGDPASIIFSTTVEGDNNENITLRHILNVKEGRAFVSRNVLLYRYNIHDGHLHCIFSIKKDWLPFFLFQFGRLRIPPQRADPSGPLYVNATAVYGCTNGALRLDPKIT